MFRIRHRDQAGHPASRHAMWGRPSVPGRGALRLAREDEALLGRHLEADAAACAGPVAIGPQDRSAKIDFVLIPVTQIPPTHDVAHPLTVSPAKHPRTPP